MVLAVFSIHYQSADIRFLEKVSANKDDMTFYLNGLLGELFFNEMTIISTCNRTEWVFVTPDPKKAVDMLVRTIKTKSHISCSVLHKIGELHIGPDALTHLFELASGLKSMVLGENEILSQIKFGHSFCMEFGASDRIEELSQKYLGEKLKIKAPKDPNKPKRGKSAFMFYCDKHRPKLIEEQRKGGGKVNIGTVAKTLGAGWKQIKDSQKKSFDTLAAKDKERYEKEIAEYNEKNGL